MKSAPVSSCISFSWIHSFRGPFHIWSTSPFCVLRSFFSSYRTKKIARKTQEVRVSAWAHTQWVRKCSQTPKYCSGSCRAHSNWACWDWSRNLFSSWDMYGFCCDFFLSSSSQCPCGDLCQSQVPEDFPGTEVIIWVCSAHVSFPLSHEHFGICFMLPWLEQALSFLSHCKLKVHCFSQLIYTSLL